MKMIGRGMLRVLDGSITNEDGTFSINNMAIIVDKSNGVLLKYGDVETSSIVEYYGIMVTKYAMVDQKMADDIVLIKFDRYDGELSIEDICTIVNYGMNCHSERFMELFDMDVDSLKKRIVKLRECGY